MKKNVLRIVCVLLCLVLLPCAWSDESVREGSWEFTIVRDGWDDGGGDTSRIFSCCLEEGQWIPADPADPEGCEYSDLGMEGNQVTYTRTCRETDGKISETNAELVFSDSTMEGYLHTIIDDPETGASNLTEHITGELKGPCPAAE